MRYVLTEDHRVVGEPDLLIWALWFETTERRRVGETMIGPYLVSTIFLGIDHDFAHPFGVPNPSPLIFETMIFDCSREEKGPFFSSTFYPPFGFQRRYRTWDEAKAGHEYAEKIVRRLLRWIELRSLRQASEVS